MNKDFSTISPSAVSLLMLKALSNIPYARRAAEYMFGEDMLYQLEQNIYNDKPAVMRLFHFENRYKTVDQALHKASVNNIIEISSGFSFRGVDMCNAGNIHYIDTDLPDIIKMKKKLLADIINPLPPGYILTALNVLDEQSFTHIAAQLPPGPVAVVNEGLLVYLNETEKKQLCGIIHAILQKRGGCWITGDIYVKNNMRIEHDEHTRQFLEAHNVEENKFADFASAQAFFADNGFTVTARLTKPSRQLSSWKYGTIQQIRQLVHPDIKYFRETWVLKAV
jgi:O-methyltransferase involved in polyketide biosynthesis